MTTRTQIRTRTLDDGTREFCQLEVKLENGRLSICGSAGPIIDGRSVAQREEEEQALLRGELLHEDGGDWYIIDRCGQIRDDLAEYFPEVVPFFPWHLNDLHAACVHQEARGERAPTNLGAECLECGWKLGHAWCARELPAEVIAWAETGELTTPPAPEVATGPQWIVRGHRRKRGALGRDEAFTCNGSAPSAEMAKHQARVILFVMGYECILVRSVEPVEAAP